MLSKDRITLLVDFINLPNRMPGFLPYPLFSDEGIVSMNKFTFADFLDYVLVSVQF